MVNFLVLQGKLRVEFGPTQVWCVAAWFYPSVLLVLVLIPTFLCLCVFDNLQCLTIRLPQSSQQEKTFSLRLMGTNSALYPQRGQDNVLMLQFLTFRFVHYLINFILLIYSDWLTVTLKESWVEGPIYYESLFKIRGVSWNKLLVPLLLQLFPKPLSLARKLKGRKGKQFFVKTDCF